MPAPMSRHPASGSLRSSQPGRGTSWWVSQARRPAWCWLGGLRVLREAGFRVTLVSGTGRVARTKAALVKVWRRRHSHASGRLLLSADLVSLLRLAGMLRRVRPDLAEFSTPKAGLLGSVAAWLCGIPCACLHVARTQAGDNNGTQAPDSAVCRAAGCCLRACGGVQQREPAAKAFALGIWPGCQTARAWRWQQPRRGRGAICARAERFRGNSEIPASAPVLGFVGRMTRDKGVPELIEAFDGHFGRGAGGSPVAGGLV